jgi:hypothetical protein
MVASMIRSLTWITPQKSPGVYESCGKGWLYTAALIRTSAERSNPRVGATGYEILPCRTKAHGDVLRDFMKEAFFDEAPIT